MIIMMIIKMTLNTIKTKLETKLMISEMKYMMIIVMKETIIIIILIEVIILIKRKTEKMIWTKNIMNIKIKHIDKREDWVVVLKMNINNIKTIIKIMIIQTMILSVIIIIKIK